ncbi:MAG: 30S ribosomal protein S8e [Candidatus Micrarchaeota archaeon]|nr:30S ribosomal protein S8e [Candidatus Micrarchaeota archaeon]
MSQFGVQIHTKADTKRAGNGTKKLKFRDKKRSEIGNYFSATKMSTENVVSRVRGRGAAVGVKLKRAGFANLLTKDGYKKAKITGVLESPDNRNFARQNIITKGTIINTELGKAVVLNRPGREGAINAKLV